jgi:hypothetical protein
LAFQDQVRLPSFKTRLASSPPKDEPHRKGRQARANSLECHRGELTDSGLDLETKIFSPPVEAELFS